VYELAPINRKSLEMLERNPRLSFHFRIYFSAVSIAYLCLLSLFACRLTRCAYYTKYYKIIWYMKYFNNSYKISVILIVHCAYSLSSCLSFLCNFFDFLLNQYMCKFLIDSYIFFFNNNWMYVIINDIILTALLHQYIILVIIITD